MPAEQRSENVVHVTPEHRLGMYHRRAKSGHVSAVQNLVPRLYTGCHTATAVNRKFETHMPRNETGQPKSQFLAYSSAVRAAAFQGVHKSDFLCSACARTEVENDHVSAVQRVGHVTARQPFLT